MTAASSGSGAGPGDTIFVALLIIGFALALFLTRGRLISGLARRNQRFWRLGPPWLQRLQNRIGPASAAANIWLMSIFMGIAGLVFLGIGIYQAVR